MRLNSFIVSKDEIVGDQIVLKEDLSHLKNVLRHRVGDRVRVIDGEKGYICNILSIGKKSALLEIKEKVVNEEDKVKISAAVPPLKSGAMTIVVQKLTEIGIANFIPILTKRSSVKEFNSSRWSKISREALKQCGGLRFMDISKLISFYDIDFNSYDMKVFAHENEDKKNMKDLINECGKNSPKNIIFFIGPEGGFETKEVTFLKDKGVVPYSLGNRILRSETAATLMGGMLKNVN